MRVVVPAALPALYRDMRILLGWAWTYLVVAELIGEKSGISAFLYQQQRYRHFENVYAGIVMIGLIGLLTDQVLSFLGSYLFPWESGKTGLVRAFRNLRRRQPGPRRPSRPRRGLSPREAIMETTEDPAHVDDQIELPSYKQQRRRFLRISPRSIGARW